jgi:protein-S-isoprenylcysteine O-methyltransferase Ste14
MNVLTLWQLDLIPWYTFALYWVITALRVKRTKVSEKSSDRFATIVVLFVAFLLLFDKRASAGPLRLRFVAADRRIAWIGILLTWVGVALCIWARYCLGAYWSARVTLKEGHQIIRTGPYRFVRHPIYAGMLVAVTGTSLVVGEWRGILAVVLIFVAHSRKAAREEALLTAEFGEEYSAYRQRTGSLFPRLWRSNGMDTPGRDS